MSDSVESRIRALVVQVAEASPPAPSFSEIVEREELPSPGPSRPPRTGRHRRWPRIAIAVALLIVLAGGAAFAWSELRGDDGEPGVVTRPQPRRPGLRTLPAGPLEVRSGEVSVWTGRQLIVWGGASFGSPSSGFADGARYDTKTGRWRRIAVSPLKARFYASAVWTGREMIVWGGSAPGTASAPFADGAAYNPTTNRWRVLPAAPLDPRFRAVAVWTGTEALIWGGSTGSDLPQNATLLSGAAYDPKTRSWRPIATPPFDRTDQPTHGVWTGGEMIIWGIGSPTRTRGAAAYKPSTDTWRTLPSSPVTQLGGAEPPVWTGTQLVVPGAQLKQAAPGAAWGAAYDAQSDAWRPIAPAPPAMSCNPISVWTGRVVLVYCDAVVGGAPSPVPARVAAYDPSSDHWQTLDPPPAPIEWSAGVWTGRQLIVWGVTHDANGDAHAAGAAYVPQPTSEQAAKLSCDVTTVPAQSASVATSCSAEGFPKAASVAVAFGGSTVLRTTTDAVGRARVTFRIPAGLPPGEATISASGGGLEASTTVVVTAAPAAS